MNPQLIILILVTIMLYLVWRVSYYNTILKGVIIEDKMDIDLHRPLLMKEYKKLYKGKFDPYIMDMTIGNNHTIFKKFDKFREISEMFGFKQPDHMNIIFVNKIEGFVKNEEDEMYELIVNKDFIPFNTSDEEIVDIIDDILRLDYRKRGELNIEGTVVINNKKYFLSNLTSISSFKNTIRNIEYSELVFNFGTTTESVRFKTFKESYDYLFNNDESDIRLIQKISNTSLIDVKGEGLGWK